MITTQVATKEAVKPEPERMPRATPATARYHNDDIVECLVENPKKPGSKTYERFKLYGPPGSKRTVGELRSLGIQPQDLPWDSDGRRKFIRVTRGGNGSPVA
jgi:hypothetical protein